MAYYDVYSYNDVLNHAMEVGANLPECLHLIDGQGRWHNSIPTLERIDLGKVSVISSVEDGLMRITFSNRRGDRISSWASYDTTAQRDFGFGAMTWSPQEDIVERENYRNELFEKYLDCWESSSIYPSDSFEYIKNKQLTGVIDIPLVEEFAPGLEGQLFLGIVLCKDGKKVGMQRIYANGTKSFIPGTKLKGAYHLIKPLGERNASLPPFVAEGYATGKTISELLGVDVYCSMSASNTANVAKMVTKSHKQVIVATDNDRWNHEVGNIGLSTVVDLAEIPGIKIRFPVFDPKKIGNSKPTDFNDLFCLEGEEETIKQLTKSQRSAVNAPRKKIDKHLLKVAFCGLSEKAYESVVKPCVSAHIEDGFSEDECIDHIQEYNRHISPDRIKHYFSIMKASHNARVARRHTIDPKSHPDVKFVELPLEKQDHGGYSIAENFYDQIADCEGIVIVRAPMGTGKTERVIKQSLDRAKKGVYIAHRSALVEEACNRMNISSYRDRSIDTQEVTKIGCCINSITNPKFGRGRFFLNSDVVCLDEIGKLLHHVTHAPVNDPEGVTEALIHIIKSAGQVIMCDADGNDDLIRICKRLTNHKITVVQCAPPDNMTDVTLTTLEDAFGYICSKVPGKKALCAFDSKRDIEKVKLFFNEYHRTLRILTVTSETKGEKEVDEWIKNPNKHSSKYDLVLFNSAVDSGISITTDYFDINVGLFRGIVTPESIIQMLGRDRTSREWIIGCSPMRKDCHGDSVKNKITALNAATAALSSSELGLGEGKSREVELEEEDEDDDSEQEEVEEINITTFDRLKLVMQRGEVLSRKRFKLSLGLMLKQKNYKVTLKNPKKEDDQFQRKVLKELGKTVRDAEIKRVMRAETPSKETYHELAKSYFISREERAQMDRYEIYQNLCISTITEPVVRYWKHSLRHECIFENFQTEFNKLKAHSKNESEAVISKTLRKHLQVKAMIFISLFETLGIDLNTGKGDFTSKDARKFVESLFKKDLIYLWNLLKLGCFIPANKEPRDCVKIVKSCFSKMGIRSEMFVDEEEKKSGYRLILLDWERIQRYVNLREKFEKNISNLEPQERDISEIIKAEKLERDAEAELEAKKAQMREEYDKKCDEVEARENSDEDPDPDDDPDPGSEPVIKKDEAELFENVGAIIEKTAAECGPILNRRAFRGKKTRSAKTKASAATASTDSYQSESLTNKPYDDIKAELVIQNSDSISETSKNRLETSYPDSEPKIEVGKNIENTPNTASETKLKNGNNTVPDKSDCKPGGLNENTFITTSKVKSIVNPGGNTSSISNNSLKHHNLDSDVHLEKIVLGQSKSLKGNPTEKAAVEEESNPARIVTEFSKDNCRKGIPIFYRPVLSSKNVKKNNIFIEQISTPNSITQHQPQKIKQAHPQQPKYPYIAGISNNKQNISQIANSILSHPRSSQLESAQFFHLKILPNLLD